MRVVAISGWKQSGKDTVAKYLIETQGYLRFAFADVLKEMTAEEHNIPLSDCHDNSKKERPLEQYPVAPKDKFSEMIVTFMHKEFRTLEGKQSEYENFKSSQLNGEQLYWTPRALLILEASIKRAVNSKYWVSRTIEEINHQQSQDDYKHRETLAVISDVRYKSEIAQLRAAFGKNLVTVRINRFDTCDSTDPSERDLDDEKFDVTLTNKNLTLEQLFALVEVTVV